MFASVFLCHCCKLGFCLFTDNKVLKIVSGTVWVGHLMTLCTCVCVCVYGMCVIPGVCVGLGRQLGRGPDGWGEWQELSALFCPLFYFDLTNITKTVLLKYIHVYTFSCVCMFIVQKKTITWQPLTLSCTLIQAHRLQQASEVGCVFTDPREAWTHRERVSALPVTSLSIYGCTLNTGSKSASSFYSNVDVCIIFMYPCWERTKVVYSRGEEKKAKIVQCIQRVWRTRSGFKAVFNIYGF